MHQPKFPPYVTNEAITQLIQSALVEDIGQGPTAGDHSSNAIITARQQGKARCIFKDSGILAGVELAKLVYQVATPELRFHQFLQDGHQPDRGAIVFEVEGLITDILKTERLVLNIMQRMSGIASHTAKLSKLIAHTKCRLLDTRKTTPNFRLVEKWAVVIGGGTNHRFGLYDLVMLKDNHVDYAGGVKAAVTKTKAYLADRNLDLKIEVETRNLAEVVEALEVGGVFRIMLDNMPLDMMREAVRLIDGRAEVEASGGITDQTIAAVAETGVDFISVGALTHQIHSLDISLKAY